MHGIDRSVSVLHSFAVPAWVPSWASLARDRSKQVCRRAEGQRRLLAFPVRSRCILISFEMCFLGLDLSVFMRVGISWFCVRILRPSLEILFIMVWSIISRSGKDSGIS